VLILEKFLFEKTSLKAMGLYERSKVCRRCHLSYVREAKPNP
jgi:hypothetical protein